MFHFRDDKNIEKLKLSCFVNQFAVLNINYDLFKDPKMKQLKGQRSLRLLAGRGSSPRLCKRQSNEKRSFLKRAHHLVTNILSFNFV